MKMNGVVPVADLARVYALKGRLAPVNTRARLEAAEAAGVISGSGARDLIAADDLSQTMRLQKQAQLGGAGGKPVGSRSTRLGARTGRRPGGPVRRRSWPCWSAAASGSRCATPGAARSTEPAGSLPQQLPLDDLARVE